MSNSEASPSRAKLWWWIGGGALVAIVIALIVWQTVSGGATPGADPTASPSVSSSPTPSAASSPSDPATSEPSGSATTAPILPELPPVPPSDPAENDEGQTFSIVKVEHVTGEVVGSGDVAAPAVRVTIDVVNDAAEPVNLDFISVTAYTGDDRRPVEQYERPGAVAFSGSLEPGATATGVFVLRIPENLRENVTIIVDYAAGQPAVVFQGSLASTRG